MLVPKARAAKCEEFRVCQVPRVNIYLADVGSCECCNRAAQRMASDDEAEFWELVVSISNLLDESFANGGPLIPKTSVDSAFWAVVCIFLYRFPIVLPILLACSASERKYHKSIDLVNGYVTCKTSSDPS